MNFLGHLYLAGEDKEVRLGNFIADHIKGIPLDIYPPRVYMGIRMHRAIDYITDSHPALGECRAMLRPAYGKYAGVALDVAIDYFLASHWPLFSRLSLRFFIYHFYQQMVWQWKWLPPYWRRLLPTLIRQNRLYRYRKLSGLCESFDIMSRTTSFPDRSAQAAEIITSCHDAMLTRILQFMPDIIAEISTQFDVLPLNSPLADASAVKLY